MAAANKPLRIEEKKLKQFPLDSIKVLLKEQVTSLRTLSLAKNQIDTVPDAAVALLPALTSLDLSYNALAGGVPASLARLPLKRLVVAGNAMRDDRVLDGGDASTRFAELGRLDVSMCSLRRWPSTLLAATPSLDDLSLRLNSLTALPSGAGELASLARLTSLDVRNNALAELPKDVGTALPALERLLLDYNELRALPKSLGKCKLLTILTASNNALVELPAELARCRRLVQLDVSMNALTTLNDALGDGDDDAGLAKLEELDVSHNRLSKLGALAQLTALRSLDASCNRLTELPDDYSDLDELTHVRVQGNCLRSLPDELFECSSITHLNVADNRLAELPDELGELNELTHLNIGWNALHALPESLFDLDSLEELYVGGNPLTTLSGEGIGQLMSLSSLYASACALRTLPDDSSIASMFSLERVDFSHLHALDAKAALPASWAAVKKKMHDDHWAWDVAHSAPLDTASSYDAERAHAFAVGHSEMQGRRDEMEDAVAVARFKTAGAAALDCHLYALFDGHGGDAVARFAAEHIEALVRTQLDAVDKAKKLADDDAAVSAALAAALAELNTALKGSPAGRQRCGATAVLALVVRERLFVVNAGDARCVLACTDRSGVRVSMDHKPTLLDEIARVQALGGHVDTSGRVNGVLAVTRSVGDFYMQPYVSVTPFVAAPVALERGSRHAALVLACDGVWDVIDDAHAAALVVDDRERGAWYAANHLKQLAFCYQSDDNISAMVVYL